MQFFHTMEHQEPNHEVISSLKRFLLVQYWYFPGDSVYAQVLLQDLEYLSSSKLITVKIYVNCVNLLKY